MASLPLDNPVAAAKGWRFTPPTPRVCVLLAWLVCGIVLLGLFHRDFADLGFRDPDDAMRLQQVRDWIGGQGWFDVSQHRVNPPTGGPMHWSRIVDLPIAALILIFRPVLGAVQAEIWACAIVPLLLLAGLCFTLLRAARLPGSPAVALLAVALLLTSPSILVQFTPLRIDHHGWQIWMAALALCGALDPRPARGGIVAGLAMAVWLQISSEGLPYAALFGGAFALRQWVDVRDGKRFVAYAATLGILALALLLATRGLHAAVEPHCDVISAAYVWPLLTFSVATSCAWRLIGTQTAHRRLLIAAIGGGCAATTFLMTGGTCLSGDPFQALGPLAYKQWYLQVKEGRPIWEQGWSMAGIILLPPLVGLAGTLWAAWSARDRRTDWLLVALLLLGAMAVSVLVMRAMTVAHLFALPGVAWLLITLFGRVQASRHAIVRVFGSVALAVLTPVGLAALWVTLASPPEQPSAKASVNCRAASVLAPLRALPTSTLFAPLDLGPDILVQTHHSVIGTAHHRNAIGITTVIEAFMATPDKARAAIMGVKEGQGADYVVTCGDLNEFASYAKASPNGLAAMLSKGRVPAWLQTVPVKAPLHVYRVVNQAGAKVSAAPFMQ